MVVVSSSVVVVFGVVVKATVGSSENNLSAAAALAAASASSLKNVFLTRSIESMLIYIFPIKFTLENLKILDESYSIQFLNSKSWYKLLLASSSWLIQSAVGILPC